MPSSNLTTSSLSLLASERAHAMSTREPSKESLFAPGRAPRGSLHSRLTPSRRRSKPLLLPQQSRAKMTRLTSPAVCHGQIRMTMQSTDSGKCTMLSRLFPPYFGLKQKLWLPRGAHYLQATELEADLGTEQETELIPESRRIPTHQEHAWYFLRRFLLSCRSRSVVPLEKKFV
jgi:hypothetical protein